MPNKPYSQHIHDEQILVVPRKKLFDKQYWQGLNTNTMDELLQIIQENKEFHPRSKMETDPTYKQIIPYLVFTHNKKLFLMQRKASASEQRLKNKYSLGIGGHMRERDLHNGTSVFSWAQREFHEEVSYNGSLTLQPLGMLNDDSDAVGNVHMGLVLLLTGDTDKIAIKSELKQGTLVEYDTCRAQYDTLENWSKLVFDALS